MDVILVGKYLTYNIYGHPSKPSSIYLWYIGINKVNNNLYLMTNFKEKVYRNVIVQVEF